MDKLVTYPDGTDQPGVEFEVANGFVARVVGDIAERNIPDAQRVCTILNRLAEMEANLGDPPCGCIQRLHGTGYYVQNCDCGNPGDLAEAESWCCDANLLRPPVTYEPVVDDRGNEP